MSFQDYQVKLPVSEFPSDSLLHSLGATKIASTEQRDVYLNCNDGLICLRYHGSEITYSRIQVSANPLNGVRKRLCEERQLLKEEAVALVRKKGERVRVQKLRTLWSLGAVKIKLDDVEHLGQFVEIAAPTENLLFSTIEALGLQSTERSVETYHDMMVAKDLPPLLVALIRSSDLITELTFGIASGVITTLGLMLAMLASGAGEFALIAAVIGLAASDSGGDGSSMIIAKRAERNTSLLEALRSGGLTVLAKMLVPLLLGLELYLFPGPLGTLLAISSGCVVFFLLCFVQALLTQRAWYLAVYENFCAMSVALLMGWFGGVIVQSWVR